MSAALLIRNESDFEALFKTWYPVLCRAVYRIVRDKDMAEDLVQDVFVKLWNKREEIEVNVSAKSYLFRAAINSALNAERVNKRIDRNAEDTVLMQVASDNSEKELQAKELESTIQKALDTLPPVCRSVFVMSRYEELSYKEIAEALNISVKTVENHMGKALKMMREGLSDYLTVLLLLTLIEVVQKN